MYRNLLKLNDSIFRLMRFSLYIYHMLFIYAWSLKLEDNDDSSRTLTCLCNDNNQCVMKPIPINISYFSPALNDGMKQMGYCVTTREGRCYTAKDINLGAAFMPMRMRRFISLQKSNSEAVMNTQDASGMMINDKDLNVERFIHVRYGCLSSDQKITFACNGYLVKHLVPKTIACCNSSDYCNANLTPEFFHHASNEDAFKTALKNQKFFRKSENSGLKRRINPELNIGPQLLSGGTPVSDRNVGFIKPTPKEPKPAHTTLFYLVLIISFCVVAAILLSTLVVVCCVYNQRIRRSKLNAFRSILWDMSLQGNEGVLRSKNSLKKENIITFAKSSSCPTSNKSKNGHLGSGSTYQTLSTTSTRNADSATDSQTMNGISSLKLRQQTISNQISLHKLIGSGRFSDVWIGTWHGESVLVKIFIPDNQLAQSLWRRTAALHRSMLLRHHTIQGLMAVDWIDCPAVAPQLGTTANLPLNALIPAPSPRAMLVGELHPWGSLQDLMATHRWHSRTTRFRKSGVPDLSDTGVTRVFTLQRVASDQAPPPILTTTDELMLKILLRMALSITQGLCFLHSEFAGTRGKPALAHRNLKPSNVFVRSDWTCCIGDIGFAVRPPPSPLPIPPMELYAMYRQYLEQLDQGYRNDVDNQMGNDDRSERTRLLQQISHTESMHHGPSSSDQANLMTSKLTLAKAELLDWWPVGGLQAGSLRYLAPELLGQCIDPFCFEAHQKADIYSLGLILWELVAWSLPQAFRLRPEPCEQCRGSGSSRFSVNSASGLNHTEMQLDRPACPRHCLVHVAYEVELRAEQFKTRETQPWHMSSRSNSAGVEWTHACGQINRRETTVQQGEPDFESMYRLVCELKIRPQLPQPPSSPSNALLVQQPQLHPAWVSIEPMSQLESQAEQPSALHVAVPRCHSTIPECVTVHPKIHMDSTASSSSGASSLKGTQSGSQSTSTESTQPLVSSTELTHLVSLVTKNWATLLPECWAPDPDARLTAQRIRKVLQKLSDQLDLFRLSRSETNPHPASTARSHNVVLLSAQRSSSSTIKEFQ